VIPLEAHTGLPISKHPKVQSVESVSVGIAKELAIEIDNTAWNIRFISYYFNGKIGENCF
jgi:hypothetical protein